MAYISRKHGKPVSTEDGGGLSFHWRGKDDQGVHLWSGSPNVLTWVSRLFTVVALGYGAVTVYMLYALHVAAGTTFTMGATAVAEIVCAGLLTLWKRRLARYAPLEDVAQSLSVPPEELDTLSSQKGVKPRLIINGKPYYSAADFGDAALLLRASKAPEDTALVRPAGNAGADHQTLLKAVAPEGQHASNGSGHTAVPEFKSAAAGQTRHN